MAANAAEMKKLTIALPLPMIKADLVVVVVTAKSNGELVKMEPIGFLCITLGLLDFSDHAMIHGSSPLRKKKGTQAHGPVPFGFM
jgi:hypothetical protein